MLSFLTVNTDIPKNYRQCYHLINLIGNYVKQGRCEENDKTSVFSVILRFYVGCFINII